MSQSYLKPMGAALANGIVLYFALAMGHLSIGTLGALGSFSFLAFQSHSFTYNLRAIFLHGLALWLAFLLGAATSLAPWLLPFVTASLNFVAFIVTKLYRIPKPDYFFVIMVYATGYNFQEPFQVSFERGTIGLALGIIISLLVSILISKALNLPWQEQNQGLRYQNLSDRYQAALTEDPTFIVKAGHFASILFVTSYLAYLLINKDGYWVLISSAAVLSGEHLERIKSRTFGRVLGTIVGISLGVLILQMNPPVTLLILILVISNFLTELFMPKNYTIANFFTNPQVIILMALSHSFKHGVPTMRFVGVFLGSFVALAIILILEYALQTMIDHKETLALEQTNRENL